MATLINAAAVLLGGGIGLLSGGKIPGKITDSIIKAIGLCVCIIGISGAVKGDPMLSKIPVMVFSSLIDESMQVRGEALGVDAHLSKPQIGNLVSTLDRLIL